MHDLIESYLDNRLIITIEQ